MPLDAHVAAPNDTQRNGWLRSPCGLRERSSELSPFLGRQNRPPSPRRRRICIFVRHGGATLSPRLGRLRQVANVFWEMREARPEQWDGLWESMETGEDRAEMGGQVSGFIGNSSLQLMGSRDEKRAWRRPPGRARVSDAHVMSHRGSNNG